MNSEEPKTTQEHRPDVNALYCDAERIHECTVAGVPIKIKEISGEAYTAIVDRCSDVRKQTLNRRKYFDELVDACVISPKIDVDRLKPGSLTMLISEIEGVLGLSEVVQKNLLNR
jgi:hypothetical protein